MIDTGSGEPRTSPCSLPPIRKDCFLCWIFVTQWNSYRSMENYALQTVLKGAIDNARERIKRSYKTAIPQYYRAQIQLLLPLCLSNPQRADLALVVERHSMF